MSKYIYLVEARDSEGRVLDSSNADGECTGCFQNDNLSHILQAGGISYITVEFDQSIDSDWIKHPLIQALVPGIRLHDEDDTLVVIESYLTTPFDQVICALRLLRHYDSFKEFQDEGTGTNQDGDVNIIGWSHKWLEENPFPREVDLADVMNNFTKNCPRLSKLGNSEVAKAWEDLSQGKINPGVLPPGHICGGYEKAWGIFPRRLLSELPGDEAGYYEKWQKYYEDYLFEHGNVNWTVDHPLCVTRLGDCR